MKIGILVTIISGFGKKGFYQSQEIGLGKEIAKMGHEVIIYKCVHRRLNKEEQILDYNLCIKYIPSKKIGVHGWLDTRELKSDLDGILAFSDTQIFIPHVYKFCVLHNIVFVPYIGIAHSFQKNSKSIIMDRIFGLGTLNIYKKIDVLCKTIQAKKELQALGVKKITVAPVGFNISELKLDYKSYDRELIRKEFGYNKNDVVVSFIARLKPEKRPIDMIYIFNNIKKQKDFKLLIIGEGPLKNDIIKKIYQYEISDKVKLIDKVPYSEMWKIHYIADYYVNLRAEEIFGMAVMEAVYYKSSVAAISAPGPETILCGMKGHCICSSDEEIEKWLQNDYPDDIDLSTSSRKIINEFTWNTCARRFIDIVQRNNS